MTTTLKNRLIITTKNTRAESKRIDVNVSKKKFAVKENINTKNKPAESKKIAVEFTNKQVYIDCYGVFTEGPTTEEFDAKTDNTHHPPGHPQDQRAQAD